MTLPLNYQSVPTPRTSRLAFWILIAALLNGPAILAAVKIAQASPSASSTAVIVLLLLVAFGMPGGIGTSGVFALCRIWGSRHLHGAGFATGGILVASVWPALSFFAAINNLPRC
jgi:hypothetical protein